MHGRPGAVVLSHEVGICAQHPFQSRRVAETHRRVELEGLVPGLGRVAAAAGHVSGHGWVKGGGREWWRWKRVVEGEKERKKTVEGRKRGGKVRRRKRHSNIAVEFFPFFFSILVSLSLELPLRAFQKADERGIHLAPARRSSSLRPAPAAGTLTSGRFRVGIREATLCY